MTREREYPDYRFLKPDREKLLRLKQIITRLEGRLAEIRAAKPGSGAEGYLLGEIGAVRWALEVLVGSDHRRPLGHIIRDVRAARDRAKIRRLKETQCSTS